MPTAIIPDNCPNMTSCWQQELARPLSVEENSCLGARVLNATYFYFLAGPTLTHFIFIFIYFYFIFYISC